MRSAYASLALALLVAIAVAAQTGQTERPTVVGAGTFTSDEGNFSLSLPGRPQKTEPVAIDTAAGRATGKMYSWSMKEGKFNAWYVEGQQQLDDPLIAQNILDNARSNQIAQARLLNGKFLSQRNLQLDNHPGLELKIEFPDGLFIDRIYLVSRRMYQLIVVLKPGQSGAEPLATKVLDSFKVLPDVEIK
jgi:hypothetical protein